MKTPTKLSQITLGQWMAYQNRYGKDLTRRFRALTGDPTEQLHYDVDYALCNYCHFTGVEVSSISQEQLPGVLVEQNAAFACLEKEQAELSYNKKFNWLGEVWAIQPLYISKGKMTHAEFEMSQDIALIFSDLQDGKDEALYNLCAAYFRKDKEPYHSDLVRDDNDRVKLMEQLPLNMMLSCRAYVIDTMNIYLQSLKK